MFYYDILVNSPNFSNQLFGYRSSAQLATNQVVSVPFRQQLCLGLVSNPTPTQQRRSKLRAVKRTGGRLPNELVAAAGRLAQRDNLATSDLAQLLLSNASISGRTEPWLTAGKPVAINRTLTASQQKVYEQIKTNTPGTPQLLRGLTGSGKTQIYIQLAKDWLHAGRSVLILVPEIGLSQQVVADFEQQINQPIWHFHSQLTKARRQRIWRTLLENQEPCLVIGPRSAALLPIASLGLVVLDEFHDDSFKQNRSPRYHVLHLAGLLAKEHQAHLVAGSATPNVDDYYRFQNANYPIHHLTDKALATAKTPTIQIVARNRGQPPLTKSAITAIKSSLAENAQALIFHNRRGSRRLVKCWECGWRGRCPDCQTNFIFHADDFILKCHRCPRKLKPPSACPNCQQAVVYSYPGTKDLMNQVQQLMAGQSPAVAISRFDSDNRRSETLARQIQDLKDRPRQIIIGTRIISKGLDLPKLKAVIIIDAEADLVTADYRVVEKNFQSLSHLAGRVGRGHLGQTTVIIQTSQPKNPILIAAAKEHWLDFYHQELDNRRQAGLPPFTSAANIIIRRTTARGAQLAAQRLHQQLTATFTKLKWYQPLPASPTKVGREYRWLIHVFAQHRADLVTVSRNIKHAVATVDLDPTELFHSD